VRLADGPGWPPGAWNWSLPVGLVAVVVGHFPDVGTGLAWPTGQAGHRVCLERELPV